jgi:hypothetical protein
MDETAEGSAPAPLRPRFVNRLLELSAVSLVFFLLSCHPVPDVNEAHYWSKAKHFWDPSFCSSDSFLNSADAHWSFYWTLGQLTRWLCLETATWTGRWIVWIVMAAGWCSLARRFHFNLLNVCQSAALLVVVTRWCHLSGEWVVGGAEAKGLAFGAVFFAMAAACQQRWGTAFLAAGIGAGFHVLVGGWTVLCLLSVAAYQWLVDPQNRPSISLWHTASGLIFGGLFSLAGLVPALDLSISASSDLNDAANSIYVLQRLPHHLVFWAFQPTQLVWYCVLLVIWLTLLANQHCPQTSEARNSSSVTLVRLVHASLGLAAFGLGLSLLTLFYEPWRPQSISLLRYYWFRTADVLLPIGVVLLGCRWASNRRTATPSDRYVSAIANPSLFASEKKLLLVFAWLCLAWECGRVWQSTMGDPRSNADKASLPSDQDPQRSRAIYHHWRNACQWIRSHTAADALFLTPRSQQTFKWYAQRSEVVSWKDVPQDSRGLLEWQQRVTDCAPIWNSDFGLAVQDPVAIHELVEKYDVDYLLITQYAYELQHRFGRQLPYRRVYPVTASERTYYVVLAVDQWQTPRQP